MAFLPNIWVCPYLTQIWFKTTQHCLECVKKPHTLKNAGLFQPKFGSNMDKCWVKNVLKKCRVEIKS